MTSGSRTRRPSSRSSCPVSSPSRTTIDAFGMRRILRSGYRPRMSRRGGWRRQGPKGRFRYFDSRGKEITDREKLARIEQLVIPPAWTDVWISPRASAKLQATGVDKAGRRQYLYHPEFRARQEQAKFEKLVLFAEPLPELRRAMGEHPHPEPLSFESTAA